MAACGSAMTRRSSLGPRFPLGDLRFLGIAYYLPVPWFGMFLVSQPGFGPGRPARSAACKAALSAFSALRVQ